MLLLQIVQYCGLYIGIVLDEQLLQIAFPAESIAISAPHLKHIFMLRSLSVVFVQM